MTTPRRRSSTRRARRSSARSTPRRTRPRSTSSSTSSSARSSGTGTSARTSPGAPLPGTRRRAPTRARSRRTHGRDVARRRRSGGLSVRPVHEPRAARSRPALARNRGSRASRVSASGTPWCRWRRPAAPGDEAGFVALSDERLVPDDPGSSIDPGPRSPLRSAARSTGGTGRSPCGGRSSGWSEPARSRS